MSFDKAVAHEIDVAERTDQIELARHLRAAVDAISATDAAHVSTAIAGLTLEIVQGHLDVCAVMEAHDLNVVKDILHIAATGGRYPIPVVNEPNLLDR